MTEFSVICISMSNGHYSLSTQPSYEYSGPEMDVSAFLSGAPLDDTTPSDSDEPSEASWATTPTTRTRSVVAEDSAEMMMSPLTKAALSRSAPRSRWAAERSTASASMRGGSMVGELRAASETEDVAHVRVKTAEKARQQRDVAARIAAKRRELGFFDLATTAERDPASAPFVYLSFRLAGGEDGGDAALLDERLAGVPASPSSRRGTPPLHESHVFLDESAAVATVATMNAAIESIAAHVRLLACGGDVPPALPTRSPSNTPPRNRGLSDFSTLFGGGTPRDTPRIGEFFEGGSHRVSPGTSSLSVAPETVAAGGTGSRGDDRSNAETQLRAALQRAELRATEAEAGLADALRECVALRSASEAATALHAKAHAKAVEVAAKAEQDRAALEKVSKRLARRVRAHQEREATHAGELEEAQQGPKHYHRLVVSARRAHSALVNQNKREDAHRADAAKKAKDVAGTTSSGAPATPATAAAIARHAPPATPATPATRSSSARRARASPPSSSGSFATPTPKARARSRPHSRGRVREHRIASARASHRKPGASSRSPLALTSPLEDAPEWRAKLRDARRHPTPVSTGEAPLQLPSQSSPPHPPPAPPAAIVKGSPLGARIAALTAGDAESG